VSKPVVLLTATIFCGDTPFVERKDPALREADYKWAIRGWMGVEGYDTLIFCENSGAPLEALENYAAQFNRHQHRLVFLSCDKNSRSSALGKGYGEMEIIRHAIDNTPDLAIDRMVVKVTGRYRALNAARLLRGLTKVQSDIVCDVRGHLTHGDSRLFAITPKWAREQLLSRQSSINDAQERYFEHVLGDAVHGTILSGGRWSPLPCAPLLYGISGTAGSRFGLSPLSQIRSVARNFVIRHAL
jgi:hypothetical protein